MVRTSRHGATATPAPSTNRRSAMRSWVTTSGVAPGSDRDQRLDRLHDGRRDVLQLVGHDVAATGQPQRGADVVVGADHQLVGDGRARAVDVGVEDRDAVAHRPGGLGEHPAELAATEDADRGGRQDRLRRMGVVTLPSVRAGEPCPPTPTWPALHRVASGPCPTGPRSSSMSTPASTTASRCSTPPPPRRPRSSPRPACRATSTAPRSRSTRGPCWSWPGAPDVEVALGREVPLVRALETTPETHGPQGLGHAGPAAAVAAAARSAMPST